MGSDRPRGWSNLLRCSTLRPMPGNLDPHTRQKLASLRAMADKVQHLYGMVERYASTRDPRQMEMLTPPLKRAFAALKLSLMGEGLDTLSQLAGSMEVAAGRGGSQRQKIRILREGIGALRSQIDQEQRKLVTEDRARQRAKATEQDADSAEDD